MIFSARAAFALLAAMAVAACGDGSLQSADLPEPRQRNATEGSIGDMFGAGGVLGGGGANEGGSIAVNRFLWLGALDTLSFLPIISTDPFSGVIATDWSTSADAPGERLKVTVYVSDAQLAAGSLRVAVFREVRDPSGAWLSAEVAEATPRRLEDAILTRARQLRVAELQAGRG